MVSSNPQQEGFSLIELMVVVCLAAILLGLAVPMFGESRANSHMSAAVNDFGRSLHVARSEALKRMATVVVCASADASVDEPACGGAGFADGWIVFVDPDGNGLPDGAGDVVLQRHGALGDRLQVSTAPAGNQLRFDRFGRVALPLDEAFFTLQICDARGDRDTGGGIAAGRWLRLNSTGWFELHRERALLESDVNPAGGCG